MSCTAFIFSFACLADWLFSGYIICSLKSYLTSFTTVILTILKSIPVLDIFSPSLLPTLNSDIHPRNQSWLLKFCWIKSSKIMIFLCVFDSKLWNFSVKLYLHSYWTSTKSLLESSLVTYLLDNFGFGFYLLDFNQSKLNN